MKNTSATTRQNRSQSESQNSTHNMQYTTKCMTQSTFQKKILSLVQRAGDKVAEAMNIVDEVGAMTGINIHFERGGRSKLTERSEQCRRNQQGEWSDHRANHSRHLNDDLCNRYGRNNHVDASDIFYESDEADEVDANAESYEPDEADYSDEINEVTLPELADMVAERTCFKPECTLCVLNTAFDIMDEQKLMLDLGTISADTSEEETEGMDTEEDAYDAECDEEGTDTEEDATYAECGCRDCDNCAHYDDCYGKSDSGYDEDGENNDGIDADIDSEDYDSYDYDDYGDCGDYDELASQPTRNTRNSRNASRSGREWLKN